ncbi:uncharacterized protein LOC135496044 [Lineus longissimus]|uniref:uncharacterized protein LOC135496044 n=1 Tax=Lineus longissimus TaxID=88925 RepID=UPI002B4F454E
MDWLTQRYIYWTIGIGVGLLIAGIITFCKLYHRQTGLEDVYGPRGVPAGRQARTSSEVAHVYCPDNTQPTYDRHQYDNYGGQKYDTTGIPNRDLDIRGGRALGRSGRNVVFESAYDDMVQQEKCDDRLGIVENEVLPNTDQTARSRRPDDTRESPTQTYALVDFDREAPPPPYYAVTGGASHVIQ